jgi:hypothetical protein
MQVAVVYPPSYTIWSGSSGWALDPSMQRLGRGTTPSLRPLYERVDDVGVEFGIGRGHQLLDDP